MSRRHFPTPSPPRAPEDDLVARALRCRRKGETRKMLIALREACMREEGTAWLWAFYGAMLAESGRTEDAIRTLRHAMWLRHSANDPRRERATKIMLDRLGMRSAA